MKSKDGIDLEELTIVVSVFAAFIVGVLVLIGKMIMQ